LNQGSAKALKPLKLYYSDTFELPLPEQHRFPMSKYRLLRERVAQDVELEHCQLLIPPAATDAQLATCHTIEYVEKIKSGDLTDVEERRIGFPWSPKMVERSRRSTGASIAAARSALEDGISCNLAGGTHHSFSDSGQGYCVFNDVCVAAKVLQQQARIGKALFFDCDVHQGNGTAEISSEDPRLFSCSIHGDKNYPFRKTDSDMDVALPSGCTDEDYLAAVSNALIKSTRQFESDIAFYLAGADPFEGDRLGLLSVSKKGLQKRDQLVIDFFRNRNIPLVIAMAGGYAPNIDDIVDIHFATIKTAAMAFAK
jgi:acetoin utilization deacetylase AcuC-like enzyme